MKIVSLWSGPRNVSTAFMYAFLQRQDTKVIDEPFYGYYLKTSQAVHPGGGVVMEKMETDNQVILQNLLDLSDKFPVVFIKNMAHHWMNIPYETLDHFENIFLIRDPKDMLTSLVRQLPEPILRDTGLKHQVDIYEYLKLKGRKTIVVDSKDLLINPKHVLSKVCDHLELPFDKSMLSWPAGPKKEDGIWAKYWYQNVHKSVGFAPYTQKSVAFPKHLIPLLEECIPYYKILKAEAITLP